MLMHLATTRCSASGSRCRNNHPSTARMVLITLLLIFCVYSYLSIVTNSNHMRAASFSAFLLAIILVAGCSQNPSGTDQNSNEHDPDRSLADLKAGDGL